MTWHIEEKEVYDHYELVNFNESALIPKIKLLIDPIIAVQKQPFESVIREIRTVCEILAAKPITAATGEHEQVVSGQRSYQDMENEMASLLVNLPNHVAYVRIGSSEHSEAPRIETMPLISGVSDNELKIRWEQIQAQTRKYGTSEQEIEDVIQQRRIRLGIIKMPEQSEAAPEKEKTPLPPTEKLHETLNSVKRRTGKPSPFVPALTFTDDFVFVLSHFPYLKIEQIQRLLQKKQKRLIKTMCGKI